MSRTGSRSRATSHSEILEFGRASHTVPLVSPWVFLEPKAAAQGARRHSAPRTGDAAVESQRQCAGRQHHPSSPNAHEGLATQTNQAGFETALDPPPWRCTCTVTFDPFSIEPARVIVIGAIYRPGVYLTRPVLRGPPTRARLLPPFLVPLPACRTAPVGALRSHQHCPVPPSWSPPICAPGSQCLLAPPVIAEWQPTRSQGGLIARTDMSHHAVL